MHRKQKHRGEPFPKAFYEEHRAEITLHKAAKDAFDEADRKVPTIKELRAEYAQVLNRKKADYREYREARQLMQEMLQAQKNVEMFYGEEHRTELEEARHRSEEKQK